MTDSMPIGTKSIACVCDSCERPAKARGYCATHYARLRRTGNAETVRKAGRPRDRGKAEMVDRMFSEWSPRTRSRWLSAARTLKTFASPADAAAAQAACVRPGGSMNVSKLVRLADAAVMAYVLNDEVTQ